MRKYIAAICTIILMSSNAVYAEKDKSNTSIGWITTGQTSGITIKHNITPNVVLQGTLGKSSFSLNNPTLKTTTYTTSTSTSELEVLDAGINFSGRNIGGRILYIIKQEPNMRTYIGTGLNHHKIKGGVELTDDSFSANGGAYEYSLVGGVDFQLQGLPNLSFSTEVGYGHTTFKTMSGTGADVNETIEYSLSPNATSNRFFLGFGMNYNLF